MKAILVIDMPNEAKIEENRITYVVYHLQGCDKSVQGVGVSLRPLPKKESEKHREEIEDWTGLAYSQGWNACIDEILGEKE